MHVACFSSSCKALCISISICLLKNKTKQKQLNIEQINYQVHEMSLQLKSILPSVQSRLHCILVQQVSLFLSPLTEQNKSQTHYQVTNKNKYKKGENK